MPSKIQTFAIAILLSFTAVAQTGRIMHNGIERTYIVHLPPYFSPIDTLPLVFSIHGLVMTAQSQSDLSEFNPIADRERFIVVYPQGLPNATGVNAWNTFSSPYHSGVDDVGFLSALIDSLHEEYHIDLSRVYSCGMSNGGFMSYRLACELNHRIAAIASVTGSMTDSMQYYCTNARAFPILHFHGTADPLVSYTGGAGIKGVEDALSFWRQINECSGTAAFNSIPDNNSTDNTTVERYSWDFCEEPVKVIHYKVLGGGHTWPGNTENFLGVGGAINLDIMASEIIWEFFKQYSLPEEPVAVNDLGIDDLRIYPNPADRIVSIETKNQSIKKIRLTDVAGKIALEKIPGKSGITTLLLENFTPGIYLLNCESERTSKAFKIIVR